MKYVLAEIASSLKQISVRAIGVLSTLLISIYIVRQYGAEANGAFQISFAYVMIASAVAKMGQDQLALREMAKYCADDDVIQANTFLTSALKLILPFSGFVSLCLICLVSLINVSILPYILNFAPTVVALSAIWLIAEALRGWQSVNIAVFWQTVAVPTVFLMTMFVTGQFFIINPSTLPLIYSMLSCSVAVLIYFTWLRATSASRSKDQRDFVSLTKMLLNGKHFWIYSVMAALSGWIDIIVLSIFTSNELIGIYQPIIRTGGVIAVVIQMATSGVVARLAILYAKEEFTQFIRLTRLYWIMIAGGSIFLCANAIIFVDLIIMSWGHQFIPYKDEFLVYIFVQLLQSLVIIPLLVSPVIGLEKELAWIQIFNSPVRAVAIAGGFCYFGLLGVIYSLGLCTMIFSALVMFFYVRQLKRKGITWQQLMLMRR